MPVNILLFTPVSTHRLHYVTEHILTLFTAADIRITTDQKEYIASPYLKINYSTQPLSDREIWIIPAGLLHETDIRQQVPEVFTYLGIPVFFKNSSSAGDFPFDVLSFIFYFVSRYEEYLPFRADAHGRFAASQSISHRLGITDKPVVDILVLDLMHRLYARADVTFTPNQQYRFLPTYDIDMVWSYLYKGFFRTAGGWISDLSRGHFKKTVLKTGVLIGRRPDPAFTFDEIASLHARYGGTPVTFFLLGDHTRYDKNQSHTHPEFRSFLQTRYASLPVGIHPSYYAAADRTKLEKQRLEAILGKPVFRSRQHYLRLRFPETYRGLCLAGITEDYSMGFADVTGFRAGIARPFRWYDLSSEAISDLTIIPFCIMDVTLNTYMKLTPQQAMDKTEQLIEEVRRVGGVFCSLWHNTSLDQQEEVWSGWREVYEHLLKKAGGAIMKQ